MKIVRRIEPTDWMRDPRLLRVAAAVEGAGGRIRLVGGAVRAILLHEDRADIDLATDLPPDAVSAALLGADINVVPTGLAHGTVLATLPGWKAEITTLRRDLETDGRHATVAFTDNWEADAARRDFTINALYADLDGALYDPEGGLADLAAGRVRFIGEATQRIEEDALRILRFFRFHARYGTAEPDPAALAACSAKAAMIGNLSGERIAAEMTKLLAAGQPLRGLRPMARCGVLDLVLAAPVRFERLENLVSVEHRFGRVDAERRLAALLPPDQAALGALAARWKISNALRARLKTLLGPAPDLQGGHAVRRVIDRLGASLTIDFALLGDADPAPVLELADRWTPPDFPLTGADVMAAGVAGGPRVGELLGLVRGWWVDGDFRASRELCLARLRAAL